MLISALWVIASAHVVLDQAGRGFVCLNSSDSSMVDRGTHGPLDQVCSIDPATQRMNRRFGTQPNSDGQSPAFLIVIPRRCHP
jgi:hypothetical protein